MSFQKIAAISTNGRDEPDGLYIRPDAIKCVFPCDLPERRDGGKTHVFYRQGADDSIGGMRVAEQRSLLSSTMEELREQFPFLVSLTRYDVARGSSGSEILVNPARVMRVSPGKRCCSLLFDDGSEQLVTEVPRFVGAVD